MGDRKREDPATVGDLQDLAEATRKGFGEALKDALGKVIPGPPPKDDDKGDGDKGDGDKGDGDKGSASTDWGFGGRWWGASK